MSGLNLVGQRFTRLTVVEECGRRNTFKLWRCVCDCGNEVFVTTGHLRNGDTKSCGCYNVDNQRNLHVKHGQTGSRLYGIWNNMRRRCCDKGHIRYDRYGARGIKVCEEWDNSFESFAQWAKETGYNDNLSIDRINNNGDYRPDNCCWSTPTKQARNRETSCIIHGKSVAEWAEVLGVNYNLLRQRICRDGLTLEEALAKPVRPFGDRKGFVPYPNFNLNDFL